MGSHWFWLFSQQSIAFTDLRLLWRKRESGVLFSETQFLRKLLMLFSSEWLCVFLFFVFLNVFHLPDFKKQLSDGADGRFLCMMRASWGLIRLLMLSPSVCPFLSFMPSFVLFLSALLILASLCPVNAGVQTSASDLSLRGIIKCFKDKIT